MCLNNIEDSNFNLFKRCKGLIVGILVIALCLGVTATIWWSEKVKQSKIWLDYPDINKITMACLGDTSRFFIPSYPKIATIFYDGEPITTFTATGNTQAIWLQVTNDSIVKNYGPSAPLLLSGAGARDFHNVTIANPITDEVLSLAVTRDKQGPLWQCSDSHPNN